MLSQFFPRIIHNLMLVLVGREFKRNGPCVAQIRGAGADTWQETKLSNINSQINCHFAAYLKYMLT